METSSTYLRVFFWGLIAKAPADGISGLLWWLEEIIYKVQVPD